MSDFASLPELETPVIATDGSVSLVPNPEANADYLRGLFSDKFGLTLAPADPESLLIDLIGYAYTLSQYGVQEAARQTIITSATGSNLDLIAVPFGVTRLEPTLARCTIRFTGTSISTPRFIPTGTRVRSDDGEVLFTTVESGSIPGGSSGFIELIAEASVAGQVANGYAPGTISRLIDPIPSVSAVNVTESQGGADTESDDRLRQRIPEALNTAAPSTRAGYSAVVKRLSPLIVDVGVFGPLERNALGLDTRLGEVDLFILTVDGLPSPELLDQIEDEFEGSKTRIVADFVHVLPPQRLLFSVYAGLTVLPGVDPVDVRARAEQAILRVVEQWAITLGTDVIKNRLVASVMGVYGVVDVTVTAPDIALNRSQWAALDTLTVEVIGEA